MNKELFLQLALTIISINRKLTEKETNTSKEMLQFGRSEGRDLGLGTKFQKRSY